MKIKIYKIFDVYKEQTLEMQRELKKINKDFDFCVCYSKRGNKLFGCCGIHDPENKKDKIFSNIASDISVCLEHEVK